MINIKKVPNTTPVYPYNCDYCEKANTMDVYSYANKHGKLFIFAFCEVCLNIFILKFGDNLLAYAELQE